jgi:hypothetical protein
LSPRLKTELWVQALIRRLSVSGKNAVVLHRGHSDAGALMIVVNHLNGDHTLVGPAPGPAYDEDGNRRFIRLTNAPLLWADIAAKIARARSFDEDLWVVEVEDRDGLADLPLVTD